MVLSKSRQSFGRGQTVIIVEDDGGVYITKTHLYHQFTTTFPFRTPLPSPDRHLPVGTRVRIPPSSLRLMFPPFS